jgi:hypothetical protein
MSEADVLDLALARSAWKSTVAVRIGDEYWLASQSGWRS